MRSYGSIETGHARRRPERNYSSATTLVRIGLGIVLAAAVITLAALSRSPSQAEILLSQLSLDPMHEDHIKLSTTHQLQVFPDSNYEMICKFCLNFA